MSATSDAWDQNKTAGKKVVSEQPLCKHTTLRQNKVCFCEVDLLTCKSEHNERQAKDVFLSTHFNFPSRPAQVHDIKASPITLHSWTEIIFALASNSPLLPVTFCIHIHMRSGREMDADS